MGLCAPLLFLAGHASAHRSKGPLQRASGTDGAEDLDAVQLRMQQSVSMMGAWWDIGRNGEAEVQLNSDWWLSAAAVHETTRRLKSRKGRRHVTLAKDVAIVRSQRKPTTKYNGLTEFQQ